MNISVLATPPSKIVVLANKLKISIGKKLFPKQKTIIDVRKTHKVAASLAKKR